MVDRRRLYRAEREGGGAKGEGLGEGAEGEEARLSSSEKGRTVR